MKIRGAFKVQEIRLTPNHPQVGGHVEHVELGSVATGDPIPQAEKFHEATPTARITMSITNKDAQGQMDLSPIPPTVED
ncbi:MAG: hypothetical protein OXI24_05670 [Candidatus Poribacteria bacterium]|nr:hypothetical protein [Candidatus Poribacteria bacterium]